MKVRRVRLILPPRMKGHVHHDARLIAKAAMTALEQGQISDSRVEIQGAGRSAAMIANDITRKYSTAPFLLRRKG